MPRSSEGAVRLKPEQSELVDRAVATGDYASPEAVVEEALRDWQERRDNHGYTLAELRRLVQEGIDSGPGKLGDWDDLKKEARRRLAARHR